MLKFKFMKKTKPETEIICWKPVLKINAVIKVP
jgi:hypothetical protein